MKGIFILLSLSLSLLSIGSPAPGKKEKAVEPVWLPEHPLPDHAVTFEWCREFNESSKCGSKLLKHEWCYDLPVLDNQLVKTLADVGASGGQCMLFDRYDCIGAHTAVFIGHHIYTNHLCPQSKRIHWERDAQSVRCCAGAPGDDWCKGTDVHDLRKRGGLDRKPKRIKSKFCTER